MRFRFLVIVVAFGLLLGQNALGQMLDDFNFMGEGARARAMGGAFVGVSDDASALTWNPAGLIQVLDPQVSISLDYSHPKADFVIRYPSGFFAPTKHRISDNRVPFSYASFTAPIRIRNHQFVASASYGEVSSLLDKFGQTLAVDSASIGFQRQWDSRLNQLRLGFGTNVWNKLNFGGGVNVYFGRGLFLYRLQAVDTVIDEIEQVPVEYILRFWETDTTKFSGFNFVGGLQWAAEKFTLGATARTPFKLSEKHTEHLVDTVFTNGVPTPGIGLINDRAKDQMEVPWMLAAGGSYKLRENLLLASDFEWRRYGASHLLIHDDTILSNGEVQEHVTKEYLDLKNGYQLRFGAEYRLAAGFATVPIRAGFRYETFGLRNIDDVHYELAPEGDTLVTKVTYGDPIHGFALTFGAGLHWKLVKIDAVFEYAARDRDEQGTDFYGRYTASSEYRLPRLSLNFTGLFK